MRSSRLTSWHTLPRLAWVAPLLVACSSSGQCIYYPCPMPTAATISVSAANAPTGIAGLTMNVTGVVLTNGPCTIAPVSTCMVMGSPGTYRVQLNAPGYKPAELNFTITGTSAGCNTCGHVDTQQLAVTMQPSG